MYIYIQQQPEVITAEQKMAGNDTYKCGRTPPVLVQIPSQVPHELQMENSAIEDFEVPIFIVPQDMSYTYEVYYKSQVVINYNT